MVRIAFVTYGTIALIVLWMGGWLGYALWAHEGQPLLWLLWTHLFAIVCAHTLRFVWDRWGQPE